MKFFIIFITTIPSVPTLLKQCVINIRCCLITSGWCCTNNYVVWVKYTAHGICFVKAVLSMLADAAHVFHPL